MPADRALRVYGWCGFVSGHVQARLIVAAKSKAAAARAAGYKAPRQMFNLCETGNAAEIAAATAQPSIVMWRGLDEFRGEYRPAPKVMTYGR